MKALFVVGLALTVTGVIALASGLLRGKRNLNISRRTTLIVGVVLVVVGVVLLATYLA
jgi:cytochrome c biogenesis protein CcdA